MTQKRLLLSPPSRLSPIDVTRVLEIAGPRPGLLVNCGLVIRVAVQWKIREKKEKEKGKRVRMRSVVALRFTTTHNRVFEFDGFCRRQGGPEFISRKEKCSKLVRLQRCVLSEILIRHRPSFEPSSPCKGFANCACGASSATRIYTRFTRGLRVLAPSGRLTEWFRNASDIQEHGYTYMSVLKTEY